MQGTCLNCENLFNKQDFILKMALNTKQHLSSSARRFCALVRSSGAGGRPFLDVSGALDSSSGVWPETQRIPPASSGPLDLLQGEEPVRREEVLIAAVCEVCEQRALPISAS